MSDRAEMLIDEVLKPRLDEMSANQKELIRALAKLEGKTEADQIARDVRDIREQITSLNRDVGEVAGAVDGIRFAMSQSDDTEMAKAAEKITINFEGNKSFNSQQSGDGAESSQAAQDVIDGDQTN